MKFKSNLKNFTETLIALASAQYCMVLIDISDGRKITGIAIEKNKLKIDKFI